VQDVRLRDPIMEWDVVEYAAYGEERVGLVLQLAAPASCVVQPLVREQGGAVGAKSLWLEHPDVALVEVELTNVRLCRGPSMQWACELGPSTQDQLQRVKHTPHDLRNRGWFI
jgi:hypothetical protein